MEQREKFGSHDPENNEGWEGLSYPGETNIDSETGEGRTFTVEDNYRQNPDESDEEYGKRIDDIKEKINEYQYSESDFGAKEALEQSKLARLRALQDSRQQKYVATDNHIDKDLADKIAQSEARIEGYRLDYKDSQSVGTPEEQERYRAWQESVDEANEKNLVGREDVVHREIDNNRDIDVKVGPISEPEPISEPAPADTPNDTPINTLKPAHYERTAEDDRKAMIIENEDNELKRFRTKEYAESEQGKAEQELEAKFNKISDALDLLFESGMITREERNQKLDQAMADFLDNVSLVRKEYESRKENELRGKLFFQFSNRAKDLEDTAEDQDTAVEDGEVDKEIEDEETDDEVTDVVENEELDDSIEDVTKSPEETPEEELKRLKAEREEVVKEIEKKGGIEKIKEKINLLRQKISIINRILTSRKVEVVEEGSPFIHYIKHELKLGEEDVSTLLYEGEHRGGEDDEYFKKWWEGLGEDKQKKYEEKEEQQNDRFKSQLESLTGAEKEKFQDIIDHFPRYKEDHYFNERWEALTSQQKRELQTMMSGWSQSDKRGQAFRNWMKSNNLI